MNPDTSSNIAVIIVNRNSGELLNKCIAALKKQQFHIGELIVVDNASTDSSATGLEQYFPDIKVIRHDKNIGFAAANNHGVKSVLYSEWIALLNPDAFPEPDWLSNLMSAVRKYPEYSFFGCRMLKADMPQVLDGAGDDYHFSGLVWRLGHGYKADNNYTDAREVFSACAAAALYQRNAFLEVGGFDEDFFCYIEDVDLGFRLRLAGYRCLYVPEAVVRHIGSAITGKHSDFSIYHAHRNLMWTYVKNMPSPLFYFFLPSHILLNIISLLWFSVQGHAAIIWKAKLDAFRGLPKMWRKRSQIQSKKKENCLGLWRVMSGGLTVKKKNSPGRLPQEIFKWILNRRR